jgi:outer membrane biosynthesis protein TonB
MDQSIYSIVEALAEEHGFDADEAMELVAEQVEALKALMKPAKAEKPAKEEGDAAAKARHNIALWTKKLEAGDYKDKEAHEAKIAKEQAKLDKLDPPAKAVPAKAKAEPKAKAAPKAKAEVEEEKPKPKEKEKAEEKPKAKPAKRIPRMSPVLAGQLTKALEGAGVKMSEELKKEFANTFIEAMTDEAFKAQGLADHMRDFANSQRGGGGGGPGPASAPITKVALEILQGKMIDGESLGPQGLVLYSDGKHLTGPDAVDDEDLDPVDFKGVEYAVGSKSGRVYQTIEGRDVLVGWGGVGKFMEMPKP